MGDKFGRALSEDQSLNSACNELGDSDSLMALDVSAAIKRVDYLR